jgi:hypothetical protein
MKKVKILLCLLIILPFIMSASPPPKKYPAQTGVYKVEKHKSSSAHGHRGCFIDSSQGD